MVSINDIFVKADDLGFADSLLPFLLIFTVIFAVLQRTQILGRDRKNFNVIVSLVIAFTVITPHILGTYPPGQDAVMIINTAIPSVAVLIIAIVLFLIIAGVVSPGTLDPTSGFQGFATLIGLVFVVAIFGSSAGWWSGFPLMGPLADPDTQALIIIILVFAIVIFTITADPGSKGTGGFFQDLLHSLNMYKK